MLKSLSRTWQGAQQFWLNLVAFSDVHVTLGLQQLLENHVCPSETQDSFPGPGITVSSGFIPPPCQGKSRDARTSLLLSWKDTQRAWVMMGSTPPRVMPILGRIPEALIGPTNPSGITPVRGSHTPLGLGRVVVSMLILFAHGLLGLWCKETLNLSRLNEFQVINVVLREGWWPGADVFAMVEGTVK